MKSYGNAIVVVTVTALGLGCGEPADPSPAPSDVRAETSIDTSPGSDVAGDILALGDTATDEGGNTTSDADSVPSPGDADRVPTPDLPTDTSPIDVAEETFVLPAGLTGQEPTDQDTSLPSFAGVLDHTGAAVTPADLVGQWTAIWFYPLASTTG